MFALTVAESGVKWSYHPESGGKWFKGGVIVADGFTWEPPQPPGDEGLQRFEFLGSYTHALDPKGRLIVPNAYRELLGEVFTVGPTPDIEGVALYPDAVFDRMLAEFKRMNQHLPHVQKYTQQFYKLSYRGMQTDGQGRILLPPMLRQRFLEDAKELEISGGCDHVRVVDAELARADDQDFKSNRAKILEDFGNEASRTI